MKLLSKIKEEVEENPTSKLEGKNVSSMEEKSKFPKRQQE